MGLISRIVTFVNGTTASATEVNAEFDNILTTVNGNIDNANVSASAAIEATKVAEIPPARVLDHADTEAEYKTVTSSGDTGTPSMPSTLEGELERIRYRMGANRGYQTTTYFMDNTGPTATTAAWYEPLIVGPNLLPNAGFEIHALGTPNAPGGWTLVSTPSIVAIESAAYPTIGLNKRSLNIVTDGANEGISVAVAGLKSGAKYLVGMLYTLTDNGTVAGNLVLSTSNGLVTGDYQNIVLNTSTEAASTVAVLQGIVKAQTPAVTMTISITATTAGGDFNLINVWMYELSDGYPIDLPQIPLQTATYSTANDTLTNAGAGAWSNRSGLSLSQYVPFRGYRLIYEVTLNFRGETASGADNKYEYAFRVQQNISGAGATTVEGPYGFRYRSTTDGQFVGGIVTMKYVVENPTPGSTYALTTDVYTEGDGGDEVNTIIFNPTVGAALATQSQARLIVERI